MKVEIRPELFNAPHLVKIQFLLTVVFIRTEFTLKGGFLVVKFRLYAMSGLHVNLERYCLFGGE